MCSLHHKKLNMINTFNPVITNDDNNEYLKNKMIEQTNSVSNKEALKMKIHEIHNFLRNNGAGYGMNALKVFNIIYGLKKIEENGLLDRVNLKKPDCEFSHLLKLANEKNDEQLAELIFGSVLTSINDSDELKGLLFYEIPQNIRGSVFSYLIKEIHSITIIERTCNVLLSGKIYEYFIGRDESAISELGAYFTDRHIVDYILTKLNPEQNPDGTIGTMIDMFGGSGGFTTGYINCLKEKYPHSINWETELNKISHYDMNEDVIKMAGMELFYLTGVFPDTKNNMKYKNSFADEFSGQKYKYPLTNPPYGGDNKKKSEAQQKREKVKERVQLDIQTTMDEEVRKRRRQQLKTIEAADKQEKREREKTGVCLSTCSNRINKFAKSNGLKGNDKESCSLMLLMDIVEVGGTAIGVLKEGVLFNKTYKDLRKCLVEKYNVREIVSIPQDQFENTSTKTSIVIFDNTGETGEKTTTVKFSELHVERFTEDKFAEAFGDIVIVENKGDISGVTDTAISTADRGDILANPICSLNGKDYGKKELVVGEGFELHSLIKICDIQLGTRITKANANNGDIPVYGGGDITFYTNNPNRPKNTLIISRFGLSKCCVRFLHDEFYLNDNGLSIHTKNKNLQLYVNYLLLSEKIQSEIYLNCTNGSVQHKLNMNLFHNLQIPIPKTEEKIQEWVDRISAPYNEKNEKQRKLKELETFVQTRIAEIGEKEECEKVKLGDICEFLQKSKRHASFGQSTGQYNFYTSSDKVKKCDVADYAEKCLIIGSGGVANIKMDANFSCSADNFILKSQRLTYIYSYFKGNMGVLSDGFNGSTLKHLSKEYLTKIKIPFPKNKQLIDELEPVFEQIDVLHQEIKTAEELYKRLIQELGREAIPTPATEQLAEPIINEHIENITPCDADILQPTEPVKIVIKKKIVKKVIKVEPIL